MIIKNIFILIIVVLIQGCESNVEFSGVGTGENQLDVRVEQLSTQPDPAKSSNIYFKVTFSTPIDINSFNAADVMQEGTSVGIVWDVVHFSEGKEFFLIATGSMSTGTVKPRIPSGKIKNERGFTNSPSVSEDNEVLYNPSIEVQIEQSVSEVVGTCTFLAQADPTTATPVEFKVSFSDVIDTASFDTTDITNSGTGAIGSWTITNCGDDQNFKLTADSVTDAGTIIPNLLAGAVLDSDLNQNEDSTAVDNQVTYKISEFIWTGAVDSNWSNASNWANNTVPGPSDIAFFDASCSNCTADMDTNIDVSGVYLSSDFTGTINQNSGILVDIGDKDFVIHGGSFIGGDAEINLDGNFFMYGGNFTSTSDAFRIGGNYGCCNTNTDGFKVLAGSFSHNNGKVVIDGISTNSTGHNLQVGTIDATAAINFYDLEISPVDVGAAGGNDDVEVSILNASNITVENEFIHTNGIISGTGNIQLLGNFVQTCSSVGVLCAGNMGVPVEDNNVNIEFVGTSPQTYSSEAGAVSLGFVINNPSSVSPAAGTSTLGIQSLRIDQGTFTAPSSDLVLKRKLNYDLAPVSGLVLNGGSFVHNNGTVKINMSTGDLYTPRSAMLISAPAGITLNQLVIESLEGAGADRNDDAITITSGHIITVQDDLVLSDGRIVGGGVFDLKSDLEISCASGDLVGADPCFGSLDAKVIFSGSTDQNIFGSGVSSSLIGQVDVNKTSGSVIQGSDINLTQTGADLNILDGTWNMAGYNLTINDELNVGDGSGVANSAILNQGCITATANSTNVNGIDGSIVSSASHPNISISDATVIEGGDLVFTVSLSEPVCGSSTTINYVTNDNTALLTNSDYTDNDSSLVIPAGQVSGQITVSTISDTYVEINETLGVYLTGTDQGSITTSSATGTIENDDISSFVWTGANGDGNWSTASNWSGGVVPTSADVAIFDGSCSNCNALIDSAIDVKGIWLQSDYTGSLTQGPGNTIIVRALGYVQEGGSFIGADADISQETTPSNGIIVTAGNYTSTSGIFNIYNGKIKLEPAVVFDHNNGTFLTRYNTTVRIDASAHTFNNISLHKGSGGVTRITDSLSVEGTLSINDNETNNGTIYAMGDISLGGSGMKGGTTLLVINGNTSQTISSSSSSVLLGDLEISSTGGTVTFNGDIGVRFDMSFTSGTVDLSNSHFNFTSNTSSYITSGGGLIFNDVSFTKGGTGDINIFDALDINGDLIVDTGARVNGSSINLAGNLSVIKVETNSTAEFIFDGASDQEFSHTGGNIPGATMSVDKASGNIIQTSNINLSEAGQDLNILNGTWNTSGFILTVSDQLNIGDGAGAAATAVLNQGCSAPIAGVTNIDPADGNLVGSSSNPVIDVSDASVIEGGSLVFNVTLSEPVCSVDTNINYTTNDNSATIADADYIDNDGTLLISAGSTSGTIIINTNSDTILEFDEKVRVTLTGTDNGSLGTATAYGEILNDDSGNFVWTGGAPGNVDLRWSVSSNWSGGMTPGSTDNVVFDGSCVNCDVVMDAVNVNGVYMFESYSGTITQNPGVNIEITGLGWIIKGGTFNGSSGDILFSGEFKYSSGTINWGSGIVEFQASTITTNGLSFYNVKISRSLTIVDDIDINGDLYLNKSSSPGGTKTLTGKNIYLSGDLFPMLWDEVDATLILDGSNQGLYGSINGSLGNVIIDSTGVVNVFGILVVEDDFEYRNGTINWGTSTLYFGRGGILHVTSNGLVYGNVTINKQGGNHQIVDTMDINGKLTFAKSGGGTHTLYGADIELSGDLEVSSWAGGDFKIILNGSSDQNISGNLGQMIGHLEIASSSNINISGVLEINGDFTYTSGTINWGTSLLRFSGGASSVTSNGLHYNNVEFYKKGVVITLVDDMTVDGNLILKAYGGGSRSLAGNNIYISGNLEVHYGYEGSTKFHLDGNTDQEVWQWSGASIPGSALEVDKVSGNIIQTSNIILSEAGQDLNILNGVWNTSGYTLSVNDQLNIGDGVGAADTAVLNQGCSTPTAGTTNINPTDGSLVGSSSNPNISIATVEATEGSSLDFTVSLSEGVCSNATNITFTTDDDMATVIDSDYTDNDNTLVIAAGDLTGTISVATTGDTKIESDETLTVNLTGTDQGSITTASATGTILNDDLCPTGYILVDGNSTYKTETFCVMQFEAKNNASVPESIASGTPWINIDGDAAIAACETVTEVGYTGTFSLVSNNEWMTIARNIENEQANWSGGFVGSGQVPRGHTDSSPASALAVIDSADPYDSTGNSELDGVGSGWEQKRVLSLSNGEQIWDLAGNVFEWTDWVAGDGVFTSEPNGDVNCVRAWHEFDSGYNCAGVADFDISYDFAPIGAFNSSHGMGRWFGDEADGSGGAAMRGGRYDEAANSGIYSMALNRPSSSTDTRIGFRCVYREQQIPISYDFTPANSTQSSESIITLQYGDVNGDLATSCTISNPSNAVETTTCACDPGGVCTVGVSSSFVGPASFDFTVTDDDGESNTATVTLTVSP